MGLRKKTFDETKYNNRLRRSFSPYLTLEQDPYFDTFLAIACYYLPKNALESIFFENGKRAADLPELMEQATICEIGKGPFSPAFRLFGEDYLAVTEPEITLHPKAPSAEHYEGTIIAERIIDLRSFKEHSLYGDRFDITLSHGLLGYVGTTGLVAGKPSKRHMELREDKGYGKMNTLFSIRNMLAVFSNITRQGGISVHRCDRSFMNIVLKEGYTQLLGFGMEALLNPSSHGGFIKDEVIAILKKNGQPEDGNYEVIVGATEKLRVHNGECGIIEVPDRFSDAVQPEVSGNF